MSRRRRTARRQYKNPEIQTVQVSVPGEAELPVPEISEELAHLSRLISTQGHEAAARAFRLEELRMMAREVGVTYLNPRARKIDIVQVLFR